MTIWFLAVRPPKTMIRLMSLIAGLRRVELAVDIDLNDRSARGRSARDLSDVDRVLSVKLGRGLDRPAPCR